jgi:signal transduction histidine kinase
MAAAALEAYLGGGASYDVEYRVQRRDGSLIWVRDRATQRYDTEGAPYFDGKLTDVTEQKLVERGLVGYTQRLEQMVRDLKVYSRQLEDTVNERNRLLIDAERTVAVSQVASMVGHDLRGPLQSISNAIYLMQRSPERSRELFDTIRGSVQYAVRILDDLSNAARDTPLDAETVDVTEIVRLALGEAYPRPGVELRAELGEGPLFARVDPVKIRRVLDNLVRNACEAVAGPGVVTVRMRREARRLVLEVQDTGVGIPEEFRPHLFKTFKTTKRRGLGLGLAYCKRAVEAHGGSIEVDSRVGAGTTFTVRIPQPDTGDGGGAECLDAAANHPERENTGS